MLVSDNKDIYTILPLVLASSFTSAGLNLISVLILITASILLYLSIICDTNRSLCSSFEMSPVTARWFPVLIQVWSSGSSPAIYSSTLLLLPSKTTLPPSRANFKAVTRPILESAPVMTITLSLNRFISF